eukprot:7869145-Pyramimonas_sp.AAC.1
MKLCKGNARWAQFRGLPPGVALSRRFPADGGWKWKRESRAPKIRAIGDFNFSGVRGPTPVGQNPA